MDILILLICPFLDLPDDGPEIQGGQPRYNIGDNVNVSCISRNSLPAAKLSWYINGEKADPIYLRSYPDEENLRTGLQTSTLGLTFKVKQCNGKLFTPIYKVFPPAVIPVSLTKMYPIDFNIFYFNFVKFMDKYLGKHFSPFMSMSSKYGSKRGALTKMCMTSFHKIV